jgi:shikimate kinase
MDYVNQQGETIYMKGTPEILFEHLMMAKGKRPLLEGKNPEEMKEYIKSSLETREPFYSKAKHIYNIELLGNGEKIKSCVEDICHMLNIP